MLKKHLMRYMTKAISSDVLLNIKRSVAESKRAITLRKHTLEIFVSITDPYSYLLLQVLPEIKVRYGVQIRLFTVHDKQQEMFPDLEKWQSNSLLDCTRLAALYELEFPPLASYRPKAEFELAQYWGAMLEAEHSDTAVEDMRGIFQQYWQDIPCPLVTKNRNENISMPLTLFKTIADNEGYLAEQGHYLPGTIKYAGEWYWAIDRLVHLEKRLNSLLFAPSSQEIKYDRQTKISLTSPLKLKAIADPVILYFSARSPYSYLGLELAIKLCQQYACELIVKPVLPMMMRGMNVPQTKKMYIFHDTKREAKKQGIPYGFVADPLGKAVENCYSLFAMAKAQGKEITYLLEFARAVNSQGILADNEKGMRIIAQRSGLEWEEAKKELRSQSWRKDVEANMDELNALGLWGVPCFRFQDTVTWGQDRLWVIDQAIQANT
ncbi:DSBA oxidoreductase [Paraglaciecola sp. T6c]|uniref:DsbA family protein n=1 Tax=Pseudoalteromonas atlantica (strain T6c / ATCC BAA-1087) TaxID=3042615 RepID=UPI00005C75AD|nr:DsbA family protein [Paraglaciecola sp. T6c]ABG39638.1 DSBA oxidoreductase [Paraglaciecola sp. T6c]